MIRKCQKEYFLINKYIIFIKKILSLTLFGLILEIAFALLSLVQFYTKFLNSMEVNINKYKQTLQY